MCDDCLSREDVEAIVQEETADLREENERLREERDDLEDVVAELETQVQILQSRVDGMDTATDDHDRALAELQSRALEKEAHLQADRVERRVEDLDVDGDRLERFTGDDGLEYFRLPGTSDPLARSGTSKLAQGDLLPIQQLSRLDDDMLRATTSSLPPRLAARVWRERENGKLWNKGSGDVREYLDASDLKVWIRRQEKGISEDYAKTLVSRTIDALQTLTKHRVKIEKRSHRKDGLQYKERRIVLERDAEIPGETTSPRGDSPETADVAG